jgi:hypothetical protein
MRHKPETHSSRVYSVGNRRYAYVAAGNVWISSSSEFFLAPEGIEV